MVFNSLKIHYSRGNNYPRHMMDFQNLRITDLIIIEQLPFVTSIRELARQQKMDPQNLTKRLAYIEKTLGFKIADRSVSGISLNERGAETVSLVRQSLEILKKTTEKNIKKDRRLRICGRGFMVDFFLYKAFPKVVKEYPKVNFDCMDLSPELAERAARKGLLDFVLSFDDILLGSNWKKVYSVPVEWKLLVRKNHPLTRKKKLQSLENYPLLGFSYIESEQLVSRKSPLQEKLQASEASRVENSRYSVRIITQSDAVAYLPSISVIDELEHGLVECLDLEGFIPQSRKLCLHFNKDSMKTGEVKLITNALTLCF